MTTIVRAQVAHTPRNPFVDGDALQAFSDGAVACANGWIVADRLESVALPEVAKLGALFTLARAESLAELRVAGRVG